MTYTNRLKLQIAACILWGISTTAIIALTISDKIGYLPGIIIVILTGTIMIIARKYAEKKWIQLWKLPVFYYPVIMLSIAAAVAITYALNAEGYWACYCMLLLVANQLIVEIQCYKNAIKYHMDKINTLEELTAKYPEAKELMDKNAVNTYYIRRNMDEKEI